MRPGLSPGVNLFMGKWGIDIMHLLRNVEVINGTPVAGDIYKVEQSETGLVSIGKLCNGLNAFL